MQYKQRKKPDNTEVGQMEKWCNTILQIIMVKGQ
jgi:hypothetical protein